MKTYTIKKKVSGTGSIYDIASEHYDRVIKFRKGEIFALIEPSYFSDGYTAACSEQAIIKKYRKSDYGIIINCDGNQYVVCNDGLERIE